MPTVYYNDAVDNAVISVRLRGRGFRQTLAMIDRLWHRFAPTDRDPAASAERRFRQAVPQ